MKGGTFGTLPAWALDALPTLSPTAVLVLVRLAYAARLNDPTVTRGELLDYTERSADQLARALKELEGAGHLQVVPGGYALTGARIVAGKNARTNARKNAASRAGKVRPAQQNTITEEVEEGEEDITNPPSGTSEGNVGGADALTDEGGAGFPHLPAPSQENPGTATAEGGPSPAAPHTPPVPAAPPSPPADGYAEAARFFDALAGYGFVAQNQHHIERWREEYSDEFLRLAWRLAPNMKGPRIPRAGFVFLLQRTQPWPEELRRQYAADTRTADAPTGDTPFVGEVRVLADGRCGRVTEVEAGDRMLTLQVGEDAADCLWIPWQATTPAVRRSA